MGGQGLLVFIGLKVLVMMTSLQNIVISGAQGLLMLMGSKFLVKMTRPQNIKASWFDRFESFGHDDLTAKHCYFRCSRPPDVDGIKIFDKDDQAAKH